MHKFAVIAALFGLTLVSFNLFAADTAPAPVPAPATPITGQMCKDCHEEKFTAKVPHFPAQEGNCTVCHEVKKKHIDEGDKASVTIIRNQEVCYPCHNRMDAGAVVHPAL